MSETITREEIKHKLDSSEPMILVETLPAKYFNAEHLPGAINIPHDEIWEKAPQLIPDKEAQIVVYCASTECRNSLLAFQALRQLGYRNVREYVEGKQHWMAADYPVVSNQAA